MLTETWNLQLFADGGEGGEGSEAGETADAAGQRRLEELGVPKSKMSKRAREAVGRMMPKQPEQAAAAEGPKEETNTEKPTEEAQEPPKKSFKDLLAENPDYNEEVQNIVKARLKGAKDAEEALSKLSPALEVLARQYKMDPNNLDFDALSQAINDDDHYYEAMAIKEGVDVKTARENDQNRRQQEREQRTLEQQMYLDHFAKLEQQGEALKATFPSFDLRTELQNPAFARMTAPGVGISVEDAYYAVHRAEIQTAAMQATAQKTAEQISKSIASGKARPAEAGLSSQAPSVATFDYRNATREQREALKARIRRGEHIPVGSL